MLSISLLGPPYIQLDGQPLDKLRRKNRALVYYLAARRDWVSRDHLLTFFWPDRERPAAQQILRTMLHDLRKQLGPTLIGEEDRLSLAPEAEIDVRAFEAALMSATSDLARLTATLDLYRGDFLDGFSLADTPTFEDWVTAERERYRSLAIRGLTLLSRLHETQQNYVAAIDALTRALAFDPLQEDLQRVCLHLHCLNGDRTGAIRRYETLRRLLRDELGVPPMPETQALYDAIITDKLPAERSSPNTAPPPVAISARTLAGPLLPFMGRAAERKALDALASTNKLILIEGEPGIGKTRLAEEWIASYRLSIQPGQQALVLRGAAHELEQGLPYQPIIDAVQGLRLTPDWPALRARLDLAPAWLAEVARLIPDMQAQFPALPAAPPLTPESRLWEAFNRFLHSLTRQRPVILFLDDLQWADASTIGLLGYLARRALSPAMILLGTARPVEARAQFGSLVQALTHEDRLARLPLASLSIAEMRALAERLSPAQRDALSEWLTRTAEGNPYFLTELVRYAYRNGLLSVDGVFDRAALSATPILPPTIRNLIQSRFLRLSETARRILDVAAVVGREFDFELVSKTAELPEPTVLDALDELRIAALIQPIGGGSFTFDHSLTLQAAIEETGEARARLWHRRVAETLAVLHQSRIEPVAGSIAHHFIAGNDAARAAPYAFRAGRFAAGLAAWAEAIAFYEFALNREPDTGERTDIFIALGEARFHKGNFVPASEAFYSAIRLAQSRADLEPMEAAYLALNQSLLPQSRFAEAIALGRELCESGPRELAVCAEFIWGVGLAVESAHPAEAEYHLRQAETLFGEKSGYASRVTLAQIKYQLAGVLGQQGDSVQAVALYLEALDLVRENEPTLDLLRHIMLYNNLAYHLHLLTDPRAADYADAGIKLAQEKGSLTHLPYLLSTSGEIALAQNDLLSAERYFTEGLTLAEQVPIPERIAGLMANLGLLAQKRGQPDVAKEHLFRALERAEGIGAQHLAVRIRLWLAPLLPPTEARRILRDARTLAEQSGYQGLTNEIARIEQQLPPA